MSGRGVFVVLEGVEGAGKSTQVRLLGNWLETAGVPHRLAREPGGTPIGEAIRNLLLDATDIDVPAETELFLMLGARASFVRNVVRPALAKGEVMVADRFELSTFAYQGVGRALGLDEVRRLNSFATGGLRPDLTVVLDLPAAEGLKRQEGAGKKRDRIEGAGDEFLERVRDSYRSLAREEPGVVLVDGSGSPAAVHEEIRSLLQDHFPEPFFPSRG